MNTMNDDRLQRFVREIILEIIDPIGFDRGNLTRFHARDMACAFLRQYQGENLMKTQQVRENKINESQVNIILVENVV